jgi:hypothetical protein
MDRWGKLSCRQGPEVAQPDYGFAPGSSLSDDRGIELNVPTTFLTIFSLPEHHPPGRKWGYKWSQASRVHIWLSFHASSCEFASSLMVDASAPDFRQEPIIRLTEPECPMESLLAIQELPTFVLSRIALRCFEQEVEIVSHEHPCVNAPALACANLPQSEHERFAVIIGLKHHLETLPCRRRCGPSW